MIKIYVNFLFANKNNFFPEINEKTALTIETIYVNKLTIIEFYTIEKNNI